MGTLNRTITIIPENSITQYGYNSSLAFSDPSIFSLQTVIDDFKRKNPDSPIKEIRQDIHGTIDITDSNSNDYREITITLSENQNYYVSWYSLDPLMKKYDFDVVARKNDSDSFRLNGKGSRYSRSIILAAIEKFEYERIRLGIEFE